MTEQNKPTVGGVIYSPEDSTIDWSKIPYNIPVNTLEITGDSKIVFANSVSGESIAIGKMPYNLTDFTYDAIRTEVKLDNLKINTTIVLDVFQMFNQVSEILDGMKKAIMYGNDTKFITEFYSRMEVIGDIVDRQSNAMFIDGPEGDEELRKEWNTTEIMNNIDPRIFHGILGIMTESGELAQIIIRAILEPESEIDLTNLCEEALGDVSWYQAIIADASGTPWIVALQRVINKLKIRYPDKFSNELAANRNLEAERLALEGKDYSDPGYDI